MRTKILLVVLGVWPGFAAIGTQAGAEDMSKIPQEKRGMIFGTMAHLMGVKLTPVAKLPAYDFNNDRFKKWDIEKTHSILLYNQLDILMEYPPLR